MPLFKDLSKYKKAAIETIETAFYTLLLFFVCKFLAPLLASGHGHQTSFDLALDALSHYASGVVGILSLSVVTLIILSFTLIFQSSDVSNLIQKHLAIPALHVSGHMLSIAAGTVTAISILDGSFSIIFILRAIIAILFIIFLSATCYMLHIYFKYDHENNIAKHGRWIRLPSVAIGFVLLIGLYHDYIYNLSVPMGH